MTADSSPVPTATSSSLAIVPPGVTWVVLEAALSVAAVSLARPGCLLEVSVEAIR